MALKHWLSEIDEGPVVAAGADVVPPGAVVETVDGAAVVAGTGAVDDGWLVAGDATGELVTPDLASLIAKDVCRQILSKLACWVVEGVVPEVAPEMSMVLPPLPERLKKLD